MLRLFKLQQVSKPSGQRKWLSDSWAFFAANRVLKCALVTLLSVCLSAQGQENTKTFVYTKTPQTDLEMVVHFPPGWKESDQRPGILFFFGGGWENGTINAFLPQAQYFASRGMVAARADYRVKSRHDVTPRDCVDDARAAMRWFRQNAGKLGMDANKIVASGGSAGGHIAACTTLMPETEKSDNSVSTKANALVLFNPVLRFGPQMLKRVNEDEAIGKAISPVLYLAKDSPPTLLFYGTDDFLIKQGEEFMERSKQLGHRTEMFTAENQAHGFFNKSPWREKTIQRADEFLATLGYLEGKPTIKIPDGATEEPKAAPRPNAGSSQVKEIRDVEYARVNDKKLLLDLYLPEKSDGALPVVVGIHGGGWANGSKESGQGNWLARQGYAVAVINYRLSGEAIFPAQIEDCKAAVRWLRANAKTYHLDPDRIGAIGHSAGGHLVSLLATTGDAKQFDQGENLEFSSRIQAAAAMAGPTDLLQMDAHAPSGAALKHDSPQSPEARLLGGPIQQNKEQAAKANPITYVSKTSPPFIIVHGDKDAVVPYHQAQLLFDSLKSAGGAVHFHTVKGGGHNLGSREANDRVLEFFNQHLKGNAGAAKVEKSESIGSDLPPNTGNNRQLPPGINWERLQQRTDANNDGKITKSEFKGPPPVFDQLDRNKDDVITKEDFEVPSAGGTDSNRSKND